MENSFLGLAQITEWKFQSMLAIFEQISHTNRSVIESEETHRNPLSHPTPEKPPDVKQPITKERSLIPCQSHFYSHFALTKWVILQVMNSQKHAWRPHTADKHSQNKELHSIAAA